jgi:hypothetical protein
MRFPFRRVGIVCASSALIFWCSCEKHKVGELPEVQKEHVDLEAGSHAAPAAPSPAAESTPTPAEFFPARKSP